MLTLKQLKVKGVRGIVDGPNINFLNGGLLLCGDNGTGKSSYVDALEKVLTDRCSSLDNRGQSVSWRRQGSHIECHESEVELVLTDGTKDTTITLDTDSSVLDKQIRDFLDAAQQQSFVLRRRTLLDFIDAIPSNRYKAIEGFLRVEEHVAFETKLKNLHKEVIGKIKSAMESKEQQERILKGQLGLERSSVISDTVCIQVANQLLDTVQIAQLTTLNDLSGKLDTIDKLIRNYAVAERI
jgi:DNA repair exonuclease SbcCD ATPase subunit